MSDEEIQDFIVLGLDVVSYSTKILLSQKLAQETVHRCLEAGLASKWKEQDGSMRKKPYWIDAGDGGFALFQGPELLVLKTLQAFYQTLARENREKEDDEKKVFVRAALHKDQVVVWETTSGDRKYTGHALNNCARLLSGMSKNHREQVVCSRPILDKMMALDETVSAVRLQDITDKHGNMHQVWNVQRSPGLGVCPSNTELHSDPLLRYYRQI